MTAHKHRVGPEGFHYCPVLGLGGLWLTHLATEEGTRLCDGEPFDPQPEPETFRVEFCEECRSGVSAPARALADAAREVSAEGYARKGGD